MFDKNNKYNNGKVLPFAFIKHNRDEAVSEIAEGNIGLEKLLNYCLDNDIVTYTCCRTNIMGMLQIRPHFPPCQSTPILQ